MTGTDAARAAYQSGRHVSYGAALADDIYADAAGRLGAYGVAFFGHRGTAEERRALREAWAEAFRLANGVSIAAWARRAQSGTLPASDRTAGR